VIIYYAVINHCTKSDLCGAKVTLTFDQ